MIKAKDAKEQIIKSISIKEYINKVRAAIIIAITKHQFICEVVIEENDDIDVDMITTSRCIINWCEYYGYKAVIINRNNKKCIIEISWD